MHIPSVRDTTSDERLLAAIAHGSIILFGWGVLAAIVLWISQRQKSAFVAFHALQALTYQLLQALYWLVAMPIMFMLAFCGLTVITAFASSSSSRSDPAAAALLPFLLAGVYLCGFGLYVLAGVVAAIYLLMGRDFYYPFIGRRIERYLADEQPTRPVEAA
jgi:uncharacterized Tic20 family protein